MKRFVIPFALLIFVPFASASGKTDDKSYKVEAIGALTEAKVAEAMRGALEAKGLRVTDDQGKTICEIWFRKEIPVGKQEVMGASFGQIAEGAFAGVINFPSNASDFRGQGVKPGWYTLRYSLILQDGNHLGVSPARDFFLLCPAASDKDPNAVLKMEELLKLSRAAIGAGHPSPWFFAPATSAENELPKIVMNENHHVILETKLTTNSGQLAIGMVVVGSTDH